MLYKNTACKSFQGQPSLRCTNCHPGLKKKSLVPCGPATPLIPNPGDVGGLLSSVTPKRKENTAPTGCGELLACRSAWRFWVPSNLPPGTSSHLQSVLLRRERVNDADIPGLGGQPPHLVTRPLPPRLPEIVGPVRTGQLRRHVQKAAPRGAVSQGTGQRIYVLADLLSRV